MKIRLRVDIDGRHWNGGAIVEVPELFCKCFEPLKTCDESVAAVATGDVLEASATARTVMKMREDAAEILAKKLTTMILSEMKNNDTHNGY